MAIARLVVSLPCHSARNGEATYWLGGVAFGEQAEWQARRQKVGLISMTSNIPPERQHYKNKPRYR